MNRILAIFSAMLLSSALMGQDEMGTIALKYPFLDTSKNHLEFYGERAGMDRLYEKLDRVIFEGTTSRFHQKFEQEQGQ